MGSYRVKEEEEILRYFGRWWHTATLLGASIMLIAMILSWAVSWGVKPAQHMILPLIGICAWLFLSAVRYDQWYTRRFQGYALVIPYGFGSNVEARVLNMKTKKEVWRKQLGGNHSLPIEMRKGYIIIPLNGGEVPPTFRADFSPWVIGSYRPDFRASLRVGSVSDNNLVTLSMVEAADFCTHNDLDTKTWYQIYATLRERLQTLNVGLQTLASENRQKSTNMAILGDYCVQTGTHLKEAIESLLAGTRYRNTKEGRRLLKRLIDIDRRHLEGMTPYFDYPIIRILLRGLEEIEDTHLDSEEPTTSHPPGT